MVQPAIERASVVTTLLKFVHLAAIALWSGGLVALPFLFWQRRTLEAGLDLDRLHRVARLVYVELTSPAAFVAIASGTALIFHGPDECLYRIDHRNCLGGAGQAAH